MRLLLYGLVLINVRRRPTLTSLEKLLSIKRYNFRHVYFYIIETQFTSAYIQTPVTDVSVFYFVLKYRIGYHCISDRIWCKDIRYQIGSIMSNRAAHSSSPIRTDVAGWSAASYSYRMLTDCLPAGHRTYRCKFGVYIMGSECLMSPARGLAVLICTMP